MPFCSKCGQTYMDGVKFCPACGSAVGGSQSESAPPATVVHAPPAGASGLNENVAGLLCYALGWVTGIIFFVVDKRPFVRFHAAQSIVAFGLLQIAHWVLGMFWGFSLMGGGWGEYGMHFLLFRLLDILTLGVWIICMAKTYQGERFRLPVAADLAEKIFGASI
jgi:uncharacterized membrane protein